MMRAKLTVESVQKLQDDESVVFRTKYNCEDSPEDNNYSKYTPSATATFWISNPNLIGKFSVGQQFYVDFTEIPNG